MQFHILTLFPEMIDNAMGESIIGRAQKDNKIGIEAINIRDFANNKHNKVDDYTYGGGAGMLMQAQPVFDAYESVSKGIPDNSEHRVIYVTPQGHTFNQNMAREFAQCDDLTILCGHYEGIDERVLEEIVTDYVSIGDFVLTGGELAAMIIVDAVARLVPGVLHNDISAETESFHCNLLEYPQYSRPEVWHNKSVPQVLLSGNQKEINKWRLDQSIERTRERRPDLFASYRKLQDAKAILSKKKLHHIDMIEMINRGRAELVFFDDNEILIRDMATNIFLHTSIALMANPQGQYQGIISSDYLDEKGISCIVVHQQQLLKLVEGASGFTTQVACANAVYTQRERLSVSGLYRPDGRATGEGLIIRPLSIDQLDRACQLYTREGRDYVAGRIRSGDMFGAFVDTDENRENEILAAVAGFHGEGSMGMLYVDEAYRGKKLGLALETYLCNEALSRGQIPYCQIELDNQASLALQSKLGLYMSKDSLYWIER